jgi:hypothetical protein
MANSTFGTARGANSVKDRNIGRPEWEAIKNGFIFPVAFYSALRFGSFPEPGVRVLDQNKNRAACLA